MSMNIENNNKMNALPISSILQLSTANLSLNTVNEIDQTLTQTSESLWAKELTIYPKSEYGYFVCVPEEVPENTPSELKKILEVAFHNGCYYVEFDQALDDMEDVFEVFEW